MGEGGGIKEPYTRHLGGELDNVDDKELIIYNITRLKIKIL
jgi:hypothetical protein